MIALEQTVALLRVLRAEKDRLDRVIAALEDLEAAPHSGRGRKGMGAAERVKVSKRMRDYWAARRGDKS